MNDKQTSSLCMRCLQAVMTEELKKEHNHEFQFVEGLCSNCEELGMVTSVYGELNADVSDKIEAEFIIMKKAYQ